MKEIIKQLAQLYKQEFITIRRHLHANPELSYQEFETSNFIQQKLTSFNIPYKVLAQTGVVAIIQGNQQANVEEVIENPHDQYSYEQAKFGVQKFFDFLEQEQAAVRHILNIENTDQNIAHHGVNVATLTKL